MKMRLPGWIIGAIILAAPVAGIAGGTLESVTIPLQMVPLDTGGFKLGINVTLGGGTTRLYEFDTGAAGFYAANNTVWWPAPTVINPTPIVQTYDSNVTYTSLEVSTTVDLGNGLPVLTANMAQIQSATGTKVANWDADVAAGIAPLYGAFFGDFGMDLGTKNGLFGILPQLPGNLSNGFIVHTGGIGNQHPTLTIGLTQADRDRFTTQISMNIGNNPSQFPNSNLSTAEQQIISGTATFNGTSNTSFNTTFVLDTGAPVTTVHDDGNVTLPPDLYDSHGIVNTGTNITFAAGNWTHNFNAGDISGENLVVDKSDTKGYINTGLIPYFSYDVMFDVQNQMVGFATPVPEPGTTAVLFAVAAGGVAVAKRRRK